MADPALAGTGFERTVRRMGLNHDEFLRSLPAAVVGMKLRVQGDRVFVEDATRRLEIRLGPVAKRRLGSLVLPQTEVVFLFEGFSSEERTRFLHRFDLVFQRGGG